MILPSERPGHPAPPEIAASRAAMAEALARWATDPAPEVMRIGGVEVLRWSLEGAPRGRVLHFHGGGYRLGCPEMEGPFALALARTAGVEVLVPRYRLAPGAPFPAALGDGLAVLTAVPDDLPLALSGGSAGGGLAASLALIATRPLAALALHSPWLDLTVTAPSYAANAESDALFSHASASLAAQLYLQGHDPRDPLASPLFGDLSRLPPTLVSVGTGEVLVDDATRLARAAGKRVRLLAIEGLEHVAVTRNMASTGAAKVFTATVELLAAAFS